jgi:hypothetical protein
MRINNINAKYCRINRNEYNMITVGEGALHHRGLNGSLAYELEFFKLCFISLTLIFVILSADTL